MRRDRLSGILLPNLPRRRFVQGLAASDEYLIVVGREPDRFFQ